VPLKTIGPTSVVPGLVKEAVVVEAVALNWTVSVLFGATPLAQFVEVVKPPPLAPLQVRVVTAWAGRVAVSPPEIYLSAGAGAGRRRRVGSGRCP
jgi:hypothetical protein